MRRWLHSLVAAPVDRDFPYYDGRPAPLTSWRWVVVLSACAVGFAALLIAPSLVPGRMGEGLGVALFVLIPLLGLGAATGKAWGAIFRRPTARDVWLGLAFAPLTFVASAAVAVVLMRAGLTSENPIGRSMSTATGLEVALDFARTGGQLMGEELVTILPFLVILTAMHAVGAGRRAAILTAWIATALVFGALHLPTYQWHFGQSLLVIGAARMMLTAPFVITRNIWSSYIAHLTNDWSLFALMVVLPKVSA